MQLCISKGTVENYLAEFGIRKLCSRFVPRFFTLEMCERRLECCKENLEILDRIGSKFLANIVTMDETPLSLFIPESRRESKEWKFPGESSTRKLRASLTHRKCMMLTIY